MTRGEAPIIARFRAMGRVKSGAMNKTETLYETQVLKPALQAGEVLWYAFEGITLKLADGCRLTVDFAVLPKSGILEMHDVKPARFIFMDDAKVKMKVAADKFPFVFKVVFPIPRSQGGGWDAQEIGR